MSRTLLLWTIAVGLLLSGCAEEESSGLPSRGVSALERIEEVLALAEEQLPAPQLFEISGSTVETQSFGGLCTSWSYRFYSAENQRLLTLTLSRDGLITAGEVKPAPPEVYPALPELERLNDSSTVLELLGDSVESELFTATPLSESYRLGGSTPTWSVSLTAGDETRLMTLTAAVSLTGEILNLREDEL